MKREEECLAPRINFKRCSHDFVVFFFFFQRPSHNVAFYRHNILFAGRVCGRYHTSLTYLNSKHVPFTVSCAVSRRKHEIRKKSLTDATRARGACLIRHFRLFSETVPSATRSGALISDNEALPNVIFNYTRRAKRVLSRYT